MSLTTKLRRIALNQQGLLKKDSFGRGKQATLRAIEQIGYVQIDTISVVERAHHHVLWSRVASYRPEFLDQLVKERKVFEYWSHAAAWLPMSDYRFALPRMAKMNGDRNWYKNCDRKLIKHILQRIKIEGPLRARDFADTRQTNNGWWDWKPAKRALEQLFMQGELMISERRGFQKVYDLTERVLPDWVDTSLPTLDEQANQLIDSTLKAHGFASVKTITYLRKGQTLRNAVNEQLKIRLESNLFTSIKQPDNSTVYVSPELLETRSPHSKAQLRILSPFDNVMIQRQRVREIFSFNYQIECYVPEPKRQYGYFCLPIMHRDRLVGRIDCKAHRAKKELEIKSLYMEDEMDDDFIHLFSREIIAFATFNGCDQVIVPSSSSEFMLRQIHSHLKSI